MSILNIAIDGPAGAGKSTIAKSLAEKLSYIYVDTGAMYRAIGYFVYNSNKEIDFNKQLDESDLQELYTYIETHLDDISIRIEYKNQVQQIILNDENVSDLIRSPLMGTMASIVSANKNVRLYLVYLQQQMAKEAAVVMDGRDIGTYVLPDSKLKIYLTASSQVRAKRRYDQLVDKGENPDFDSLKKEIEERDYRDMNREFAPLKKAEDAILCDSSNMTIEEVVDFIYNLAKKLEK